VNGKIVNIPSYLVKPNDIIEVRDKSKKQLRVLAAVDLAQQRPQPQWLDINTKDLRSVFKSYPDPSDFPAIFKVSLVVELFSK
jgi:small subunit ribosomal protein S4